MLDEAIVKQLQSVFADIESDIHLVIAPSEHEKQAELRDLVENVAACSDHISVHETGKKSNVPHLTLVVDGSPTGVVFRGVPGGHEFTSLAVSILNAAGKGRLPDNCG